jgi:hypothetical protein
MNEWAKTVKRVYDQNKHKAGYKLKDAMRDAKKVYKPVGQKKDVHKTAKKHHRKSRGGKGKSKKQRKSHRRRK